MGIEDQIENYFASQLEEKEGDLRTLHKHIVDLLPNGKIWFLDGKDATGKVVSNPNIGFGSYNIQYTNGKTKEFYQIGISANSSGISVYIMGIADKYYLPQTYKETIGKAKVTGYCIQFKSLKDIHFEILEKAILDGIRATETQQ